MRRAITLQQRIHLPLHRVLHHALHPAQGRAQQIAEARIAVRALAQFQQRIVERPRQRLLLPQQHILKPPLLHRLPTAGKRWMHPPVAQLLLVIQTQRVQCVPNARGRLAQLPAHSFVLNKRDQIVAQQRHFAQFQQGRLCIRVQRIADVHRPQLVLKHLGDALCLAGELRRRVVRVLQVKRGRRHDQEVRAVIAALAVAVPVVGRNVARDFLHFQFRFR